jgi:hypothetical protein
MRLDGESVSTTVATGAARQHLTTCKPEELLGARARANNALPDSDPSKLTAQWVSDLRIAAKELGVLRRALHPGDDPAQSLTRRLAQYASVIAAVIGTEPESGS